LHFDDFFIKMDELMRNMKECWQIKREVEGRSTENPNIVMSSAVRDDWKMAARSFNVEQKYVSCETDRHVINLKETVGLVDENTIGICLIVGHTFASCRENHALLGLFVEYKHIPIYVEDVDGIVHFGLNTMLDPQLRNSEGDYCDKKQKDSICKPVPPPSSFSLKNLNTDLSI
jgi:hypothetical protein